MKSLMKKNDEENSMRGNARSKLLTHIRDMARDAMSNDMGGLEKVTVAADNKQGLKKGLDKAKEVLDADGPSKDMMESMDEESDMAEKSAEDKVGSAYEAGEEGAEGESHAEHKDEGPAGEDMEAAVNGMTYAEKCKMKELLDKHLETEKELG